MRVLQAPPRPDAVKTGEALERYSPFWLSLVGRYLTRYFCKHFNALRIYRNGASPVMHAGTIVYANHSSWWDPVVLLLIASREWPSHRFFAPIDALALERYSILARLGLFPIDAGSRSGVRDFLRTAETLLESRDCVLALTPQGRFGDHRRRPTALRPGLAHLLGRSGARRALPVAVEYTFWNERLPEVLIAFGDPISAVAGERPEALNGRLQKALEKTQDGLARAAIAREDSDFREVIASRHRGVGRCYDAFEHLRALRDGRRFGRDHGSLRPR